MKIPGTIPLTGTLAPNDSADTYPVTDPQYGIDGLYNVPDYPTRDAIVTQRRRAGMVVGVQQDQSYWSLLPSPWSFTDADWIPFAGGGGGELPVGGAAGTVLTKINGQDGQVYWTSQPLIDDLYF